MPATVPKDHLAKGGEQPKKAPAKTISYCGKKYKWVSPATFNGEEHELARDYFGVTKSQIMSLSRLGPNGNNELEEHDFNATSCGAFIAVRRVNPEIDVDEFKNKHEPISIITELMGQLTEEELQAIVEITGIKTEGDDDDSAEDSAAKKKLKKKTSDQTIKSPEPQNTTTT